MFLRYSKILVAVLTGCLALTVNASNDNLNSPSVKAIDDYTLKGAVNFYNAIEPGDADGNINVVVEIPKGSTGKWEVNPDDGTIVWEFKKGKPRTVDYLGGYPANYGSVPRTSMPKEFNGDGDSLDVVIIGDPIPRGEVVKAKVIGILHLKEGGDEYDGKLLAVKIDSPEASTSSFEELDSKFGGVGTQVAEWFAGYKGPGEIVIESIGSTEEAMEIVNASANAF
ncbi:MAG: inorganic diphosphatase [Gammaproteobacteria bacterium]|nr:inorganic diphosphatase [Gammaproteobacteria bacterium]